MEGRIGTLQGRVVCGGEARYPSRQGGVGPDDRSCSIGLGQTEGHPEWRVPSPTWPLHEAYTRRR